MMASKSITVTEALKRLKEGGKIEGITIDFENKKVKALDHLIEELIRSFYSANQLIKGK